MHEKRNELRFVPFFILQQIGFIIKKDPLSQASLLIVIL